MPSSGPRRFARTAARGILLLAICLVAFPRAALAEAERVWSQERVVLAPDGEPVSPLRVRAEHLSGLTHHSFPLSESSTLVVKTNVADAERRGLPPLAAAVARAWNYVEGRLGIAPRGDVLLYLVEVDRVPEAYRFEAEGTLDSRFGEVRLAWIPEGASLWGASMPEPLAELVFDTLPHEFVHDQIDQLPRLRQDLSHGPSPGTRWFVEGLCEMVAKEFCHSESPATWARLVRMRRLDRSERLLRTIDPLLSWNQKGVAPQRESDLYGASMLLVQVWTDRVDPREILHDLAVAEREVDGPELLRWMRAQVDADAHAMLELANARAIGTIARVANEEARASKRTGLPSR